MQQQHRILETISSPECLARVAALLAAESFSHRTALADRVCAEFRFADALGQPQLASCLKALRTLHSRGCIALPPPVRNGGRGLPRLLGRPVPAPLLVPPVVHQVEGLRLDLVRTDEQRRTWNELIEREHPQGAACHAGPQLRYLLLSRHGILGAIGFAASALALADRDRWIGWDPPLRLRQLHRVLALSRFLVRPSVRCRNLASKALGLCLRCLPADFLLRYGYAPLLLETFVDRSRHDGTCLKASNWIPVGHTAGRGRCAPTGTAVPVKSIFLYPLRPDWRRQLGLPDPQPLPDPVAGLERPGWAALEFDGAPLGDVRLSRRLARSAAVLAVAPRASFPSAAQSDQALMKAYYRLIDQPADSAVTPENILAPHRARTIQRMRGAEALLCIQDGTDLNFAEHPGCEGLGLIGKNSNSKGTLGLHMHSTLVVNGDGVPLGVPLIQYEAPDGKAEKGKPLEERKTQRWARGLRDCAALAARLGGARPVSVLDREADVFELFDEQRRLSTVDLLVRAKHNRSLGKGVPKLFDAVRAAPAQARRTIHVLRSSARRGTRRQAASELREARQAEVALRWRRVRLPAPGKGAGLGREPVELSLVHVWEESAPAGAEPLEWFLLTSLEASSERQAERVLEWYRLRWRIEDWHRVLKSGCKVEYLGHRRGERIERAVTIKAVIAWRLTVMTLLGRDTPELAPDTLFSDTEIAALGDFATDRQLAPPDNLGRAVLTTAMLGGHLNRKHDLAPGNEVIWEGYTRLATIAQSYERLLRLGPTSNLYQSMPKSATCG